MSHAMGKAEPTKQAILYSEIKQVQSHTQTANLQTCQRG